MAELICHTPNFKSHNTIYWRHKFRKGMMMYICESSNQVEDNATMYRNIYFRESFFMSQTDYIEKFIYLNFRWIFYSQSPL